MATQKEAMIWGAVAGVTTVLAETLTIDPASLFKAFDPDCIFWVLREGIGSNGTRGNCSTS